MNGREDRHTSRILRELPVVTQVGTRETYFLVNSWVQPEYVFTCPEFGHTRYRMENRTYVIEPGMLSLMPPYMLHVVRPRERTFRKYVAHFTLPGHALSIAGLPTVIRVPDEVYSRVLSRFREMLSVWSANAAGRETIVGGIMAEFLGYYIQFAGAEAEHELDAPKCWKGLADSVAFIREHLHRDITLAEISRQAGLTPSYFGQIFRRYIGVPPHTYLNNCRIERAKRLILNESVSCTEAADLVGFQTVHAFSKVFKRHTGKAPTDWLREFAR